MNPLRWTKLGLQLYEQSYLKSAALEAPQLEAGDTEDLQATMIRPERTLSLILNFLIEVLFLSGIETQQSIQ